jgi:hypothetical protein
MCIECLNFVELLTNLCRNVEEFAVKESTKFIDNKYFKTGPKPIIMSQKDYFGNELQVFFLKNILHVNQNLKEIL